MCRGRFRVDFHLVTYIDIYFRFDEKSSTKIAALSCLVVPFIPSTKTWSVPRKLCSGVRRDRSLRRLVALDILRIESRRHIARDMHCESIFCNETTETCGHQMHLVFTWLGVGMIRFPTLQGHAVTEIPVIRNHRVLAAAVGSEPKCGSRIPVGGVVCRHLGSNCGDVVVDYFQDSHGMRGLMKSQHTSGGSGYLPIIQNIHN